MGKALSVDFRDRVVASVDSGLFHRKAAERLGVSISSAIRWTALGALPSIGVNLPKHPHPIDCRVVSIAPVDCGFAACLTVSFARD